jgi:hypothetical protein
MTDSQILSRFTGGLQADLQAGSKQIHRQVLNRFTGRVLSRFSADSKQIYRRVHSRFTGRFTGKSYRFTGGLQADSQTDLLIGSE